MKARVTVTLDQGLLRAAEKRAGKRSRSYAIDHALRVADRLSRAQETAAYYQGVSPEEREEERAWGELAALAAAALERKPDGGSKK
jgi:hypothetical protein